MKINSIECITDWKSAKKVFDLDIIVRTENNLTYVFTLITIEGIESIMEKKNIKYFPPVYPYIIVSHFTEEIIEETINALAQDCNFHWMRFYHFSDKFEANVLNELHELDSIETNSFNGLDNF